MGTHDTHTHARTLQKNTPFAMRGRQRETQRTFHLTEEANLSTFSQSPRLSLAVAPWLCLPQLSISLLTVHRETDRRVNRLAEKWTNNNIVMANYGK